MAAKATRNATQPEPRGGIGCALPAASDTCRYLRISRSLLTNLRRARHFPEPIISRPRFVRWRAEEVEAWGRDPEGWIAANAPAQQAAAEEVA